MITMIFLHDCTSGDLAHRLRDVAEFFSLSKITPYFLYIARSRVDAIFVGLSER